MLTKEYILQILNEAYALDPAAIHSLLCTSMPVNQDLANHPTIPVRSRQFLNQQIPVMDILNLINGFLTTSGQHIILKWSDDKLSPVLLGFELADLAK